MNHNQFKTIVAAELESLRVMLVAKNAKYGNSALDPVRIFSKADSVEQLLVRIDDKLSRLSRGPDTPDVEDTLLDLIGYLVMLRVAQKERAKPTVKFDPYSITVKGDTTTYTNKVRFDDNVRQMFCTCGPNKRCERCSPEKVL